MMQERHQLPRPFFPDTRQASPLLFVAILHPLPVILLQPGKCRLRYGHADCLYPAQERPFARKVELMPQPLPALRRDARDGLQPLRRKRQP